MRKENCPNCDNEITNYKQLLADAREDFEEIKKDYEDRLATKELDNIVLKVKLEGIEQKSSDVIDDVIERTQGHMLSEITKYRKEHELKVANILTEAKEYFRRTNLEKEREIAELKKEIESITLKAETIQRKKNLEIAKLKKEKELIAITDLSESGEANKQKGDEVKGNYVKGVDAKANDSKANDISGPKRGAALREEHVLSQNIANEVQEMLRHERKTSEGLGNEVNVSDQNINRLKAENIELNLNFKKSRAASHSRETKKPKVPSHPLEFESPKETSHLREPKNQNSKATPHIQEPRNTKATPGLRDPKSPKATPHLKEPKYPKATPQLKEPKSPKATPQLKEPKSPKSTPHLRESKNPKSTPHLREPKNPKATPHLQDPINPRSTPHLYDLSNPRGSSHSLKTQKPKATSQLKDKSNQKPKSTRTELIRTFLLIVGNVIFIFVIYPNIAGWIESIGLNDLSITIRILITIFGIMVSLFCFVKSRESSSKRASHRPRPKDEHSLRYLLGLIAIGVVLLIVFLFSSNFLFFLIGTILITLAGILVVNHGKHSLKQKNVRKRARYS